MKCIERFKNGEFVVECATKDQAKEAIKICKEHGINKGVANDKYDYFYEGMCLYCDVDVLMHSSKDYYTKNWYEIITFEQFMFMISEPTFTKNDLKTGMLVVLRNGMECVVVRGGEFNCEYNNTNDIIVNGKYHYWMILNDYHENLLCKSELEEGFDDNKEHDIMEVYLLPHPYCMQDVEYEKDRRELLWKREERKVKQLTLEEISELLGYEVEIVGGK